MLLAVLIFAAVSSLLPSGCGGRSPWLRDGGGGEKESGAVTEGEKEIVKGAGMIAFVRDCRIWTANEDGSDAVVVSPPGDTNYGGLSISPDGRRLAAWKVHPDGIAFPVMLDLEGHETDLFRNEFASSWTSQGLLPTDGNTCWDGNDAVYVTATMRAPDTTCAVVRIDIRSKQVRLVATNAANPAVSPDGKILAYIAKPADWEEGPLPWRAIDSGDLVIMDTTSGTTRKLTEKVGVGYFRDVVFSPDGKTLAASCYSEPDTSLLLIDREGNLLRNLTHVGPAGQIGHPWFSPDGAQVIFHFGWKEEPKGLYSFTIRKISTRGEGSQAVVLGDGMHPAWGRKTTE